MRVLGGLAGTTASVVMIGLSVIPAAWAGAASVRTVAAGSALAATAPGTTLYVDFNGACNDKGPGTQAEPFCTIQAAADVVNPGQTVEISEATPQTDPQSVIVTRSGTPAEPITFTVRTSPPEPILTHVSQTGHAVITLEGVHDVNLSHLEIETYQADDGIDVTGSSDISVSDVAIIDYGRGDAGISIDGASSDVTVTQARFLGGPRYGVLSAPGARQVTVTDSLFTVNSGSAFVLRGTTGAVVTGNTAFVGCGANGTPDNAVSFADGSSGTVENNVLEAATTANCTDPATALSVDASSAASAGGVTADYNALYAGGTSGQYSWAGTAYADPASFAATGQGAHDVTVQPFQQFPPEGSPAIDSADCSAPGEPGTDIFGRPRVRDPLATGASLGNGTCYADRGAYERQDGLPVTYTTPSPDSAGYPAGAVPWTFALTVTSAATSPWHEPVSYTVDFGDGSGAAAAAPGTPVSHQYQKPGQYTVTVTAADTSGSMAHSTYTVYALPSQPTAAALSAAPEGFRSKAGITPDMADFTATFGDASWEVATQTIAYGGNGSPAGSANPAATWAYIYSNPGTYTATMTVTDKLGRTSTAKATVTVGDEPQDVAYPKDVYSRVVAAHAVVKIPRSTLELGDCCSRAALVKVIVTSPRKGGYVTVYQDGRARPGLPTVWFQAGRSAENSALATGTADFYNGSAGPIRLDVITYGLDDMMNSSYGVVGDTYQPVTPARVLATKLAGGRGTAFQVVGRAHVPLNAQQVVLDVTASGGTTAGHYAVFPNTATGHQTPVTAGYWAKGQRVTELVTVPGGARTVVTNNGKGAAYFSASVVGYYLNGGSAAVFVPAAPARLASVTIAARHSVTLAVRGKRGVPAAGATAVAVNLTASRATAPGTVTAYADKTPLPALISLSYAPGAASENAALVAVGGDGAIRLYNGGSKPVTVWVDLGGSYYAYGQ